MTEHQLMNLTFNLWLMTYCVIQRIPAIPLFMTISYFIFEILT